MTEPKIQKEGAGLSIFWPNSDLTMDFQGFTESRSLGLACDVAVTVGVNGHAERIEQARAKLASCSERMTWSKRLQEIYPSLDWKPIIQQAFIIVQHEFRKGEPAIRLSETELPKHASYRLNPLVYDGLPATMFCEAGSGKSYLGLLACMLVETGTSLCGLLGVKGKSLFLDWEVNAEVHGERWRAIRAGHSEVVEADPLCKRMNAPLADDLRTVQRLISKYDINFMVVDSLGLAAGSELQGAETALRFFQALRTLPVSTLIIGHTAKNTETKSIYGSVFFHNLSRTVFELKKVQESDSDTLRIALHHRKSNLGRLQSPLGLDLSFSPQCVKFSSFDIANDPELATGLSKQKQIEAVLLKGPKTSREVAEITGIDLGITRTKLTQGKGRWVMKMGKKGSEELWGVVRTCKV